MLMLTLPASVEHVKENATIIELTEEEMEAIDRLISSCQIAVDRYHPFGMTLNNM